MEGGNGLRGVHLVSVHSQGYEERQTSQRLRVELEWLMRAVSGSLDYFWPFEYFFWGACAVIAIGLW